jgi:DtxR family Mn-dependent transcriptional regulator
VLRHHRLLELYLTKLLGFSWDQVHAEAERLEHVISEEFENRIDQMLGHPTHDPHGAPIPSKEGFMPKEQYPKLSDLNAGDQGTIQYIKNEDPSLLQYIGGLGMYPGTRIEIVSIEPFGGPISILVSNKKKIIGKELAEQILIKTGELV